MKISTLLKKLHLDKKEFITSGLIRGYCKSLKLKYDTTIRYLIARGYLVRIFRGVFYVKSLEETKLGRTKYTHLELVSMGLELKNVKNWYFGLYTALKLNNMTHEYFAVEYVVNDKIFRANPMSIAGHKFKFVKILPSLLSFGIIKNNLKYSDPEKTVLDFIYIWRYNGIPKEKILADLSEWTSVLSKKKIKTYANNYPKSVRAIAEEVVG